MDSMEQQTLKPLVMELVKEKPKQAHPVSPKIVESSIRPSYAILAVLEYIGTYVMANSYYLTEDDLKLLASGQTSDRLSDWMAQNSEFNRLIQSYFFESE